LLLVFYLISVLSGQQHSSIGLDWVLLNGTDVVNASCCCSIGWKNVDLIDQSPGFQLLTARFFCAAVITLCLLDAQPFWVPPEYYINN
jgi:hypothetical protein